MRLGHVGRVRLGHAQPVRHTRPRVHSDVHLHPQTPIVPLLRLVQLRVALAALVLGRGRRRDDAGVHDRARLQPQPLVRKVRVDRRGQLSSKTPALPQIAQVQDRRLVLQRLGQVQPDEGTRRLGFVEQVPDALVAEVVVEMKAVNAPHGRHPIRWPPAPPLGVAGWGAGLQFGPGDQPVGPFEEPFAARRAPLPLGFHAGQRRLTHRAAPARCCARPSYPAPTTATRSEHS